MERRTMEYGWRKVNCSKMNIIGYKRIVIFFQEAQKYSTVTIVNIKILY